MKPGASPSLDVVPLPPSRPLLPSGKGRVFFLEDNAGRERLLASQPQAALVADHLPLRANLSVLENIALVPQFRLGLSFEAAARRANALLERIGFGEVALLRDPDIGREARFVTKIVRAVLQSAPIILVDRPAAQLPDLDYPPFLEAVLGKLEADFESCWIVDYRWNARLYDRPDCATSD